MKTMSYVQAVKLAVACMESRAFMDNDGWFWVNRWKSYMIVSPVLTNYREI